MNQGWQLCANVSGFSAFIGPFYQRQEENKQGDAQIIRALPLQQHHQNPEGVIHGGVYTAMADFCIYRAIGDVIGHEVKFATINLNCDFLAAALAEDEVLMGKGKITRLTKSVIFAEGLIYTKRREILRATGIWKILG
ncbi:PaaI family thioesterase [Thalassomonas sp. M1454]|nr:PaaI family thioesterase [Thalassomonas sp. M1454]